MRNEQPKCMSSEIWIKKVKLTIIFDKYLSINPQKISIHKNCTSQTECTIISHTGHLRPAENCKEESLAETWQPCQHAHMVIFQWEGKLWYKFVTQQRRQVGTPFFHAHFTFDTTACSVKCEMDMEMCVRSWLDRCECALHSCRVIRLAAARHRPDTGVTWRVAQITWQVWTSTNDQMVLMCCPLASRRL